MESKRWIFISPHFDDVALSCGGLVWALSQAGQSVEVWTLMAGIPGHKPYSDFAHQNHSAWGMSGEAAIRMRMAEDRAACVILGAQARYFRWGDAIYRQDPHTGQALVNNDDELFGKAPEPSLVEEIAQTLRESLPADSALVFPMGLGNHIDHRAAAQANQRIGRATFYYADYPYILKHFDAPCINVRTPAKIPCNLGHQALGAWQEAVLCYRSQLSGFWRDDAEARLSLQNYFAGGGGRLWQ